MQFLLVIIGLYGLFWGALGAAMGRRACMNPWVAALVSVVLPLIGLVVLLIIGATGDPATPYQNAVTMAKQLKSGVLVTYEGEGHGTFGGKSTCVDALVIDYLTKGTVPTDGVRCQ